MRVLITGAARAIGRATVEVLAERGHDVVATARDVGLLAGLPAARVLPLDVRAPLAGERKNGLAILMPTARKPRASPSAP